MLNDRLLNLYIALLQANDSINYILTTCFVTLIISHQKQHSLLQTSEAMQRELQNDIISATFI